MRLQRLPAAALLEKQLVDAGTSEKREAFGALARAIKAPFQNPMVHFFFAHADRPVRIVRELQGPYVALVMQEWVYPVGWVTCHQFDGRAATNYSLAIQHVRQKYPFPNKQDVIGEWQPLESIAEQIFGCFEQAAAFFYQAYLVDWADEPKVSFLVGVAAYLVLNKRSSDVLINRAGKEIRRAWGWRADQFSTEECGECMTSKMVA